MTSPLDVTLRPARGIDTTRPGLVQEIVTHTVTAVTEVAGFVDAEFAHLFAGSRYPAEGPARLAPPPLGKPNKEPVLIVPGLMMDDVNYLKMGNQVGLASSNASGRSAIVFDAASSTFWDGKREIGQEEITAKGFTSFVVQFPDPRASPKINADEVDKAYRTIKQMLGVSSMKIISHSAGCNAVEYWALNHADDESVRISQWIPIGWGPEGTEIGKFGAFVKPISEPAGIYEAARDLAYNSEFINTLRSNWPRIAAKFGRIDAVAVTNAETVDQDGRITKDGDGFMVARVPPGANLYKLKGDDKLVTAHLAMCSYNGVILTVQKLMRDFDYPSS
jgi:hypothetical protein